MIFGLFSDIHYFSKPCRLRSALRLIPKADVLLMAGDITDRGTAQQFDDVFTILTEECPQTAVFPVCGNHDVVCSGKLKPDTEGANSLLNRYKMHTPLYPNKPKSAVGMLSN